MEIKWLILDVDGVLTDGRLFYGENGTVHRVFSIHDGLALAMAPRLGLSIGLISGRPDKGLRQRARELGIQEVHFRVEHKETVLMELVRRQGLQLKNIAYMGDDLNDVPAMEMAGYRMTVPDAPPVVLALAHWVSPVPGGQGAVRKAVEHLMEIRGEDFSSRVLEILRSHRDS